jgi:general secretion pathway protein D
MPDKSMGKQQDVTRFLASAARRCVWAFALASCVAFAQEEKVTLNFVNADIVSVIKTVGGHTGRNFILDPRVTGTVNIVSDAPVPKSLLYPMLLSVLRTQGYAAIESDGFVKIVPEAEAKTGASPMGESAAKVPGDRIVTQVFLLHNESAVQLVPVLRPLVTANNFVAAYPNNNAIVITDYAENVRRIERIIRSIDLPSGGDVQMVRLEHASAVDVAQTIARVIPETAAPANAPGTQPKAAISVDARTNSLLVRGDSPAVMTRIKTLAASLDTPGAGSGNIHVVYLRNAEATRIADTLRGLLSGSETGRSSGGIGSAATANPAAGMGGAASSAPAASVAAAPASVVQAFPQTNTIIITAPEPTYRALRAVIDKLDTRRAQVLVEALIVEVGTGRSSEFGVQFQGFSNLTDPSRGVVGGTNFSTSPSVSTTPGTNIIGLAQNLASIGTGLNIGVVNGRVTIPGPDGKDITILNLGVLARAFEGDSGVNVLSTPNILTLDNEEAKLLVGQNVPFITGSYTPSSTSAANPFQTIERKDIGLTLKVKPQITEAGTVKLSIFQEVSSISRDASVKGADLITNKRSLESTVLVDDGQIVVMGGLIQDDQQSSIDKVPLLGDIPFLGSFFKYETRSHKKTNLMVFLRPFVLRDESAARALTAERYDYIRNLQGTMGMESNLLLPEVRPEQLPALPATRK